MSSAATTQTSIHGHIAARIDRLPLTRVQWQLAILVEITWGFIIFDTDGIGARLYPFVWRPNHIIDIVQYAVIQALQVGAGILLGVYIMSWVAERVAPHKRIRELEFIDQIPKSASGKILRRVLMEKDKAR